jgi:NADPH:quinone reductase-like Zn-dependent oxidoreductase
MKCILHQGTGLDGVRLGERAKPVARPGYAVVRLKAAALNHRDIWTALGGFTAVFFVQSASKRSAATPFT